MYKMQAYTSVLKAVFEGYLFKDVTEIEICAFQLELYCFILDFFLRGGEYGQPSNSARLNKMFYLIKNII